MAVPDSEPDSSHADQGWFCTTRWSVVLLAGKGDSPQAAEALAVCRLRQRYRDLVREEVAHTVARPEEVQEELRWLFKVLSR